MVIIYNYGMQLLRQQQTNASPVLAILVAMAMRQYSTEHINIFVVLVASI